MDANFVFNEVTSNFQAVTIQGQFTYRIHDPKQAAELLNFTMDPATHQSPLQRPRPAGAADHQHHPDGDPHRAPEAVRWRRPCRSSRRSPRASSARIKESAAARAAGGRAAERLLRRGQAHARGRPRRWRPSTARPSSARPTRPSTARRAAAVEEERKIKENELTTDIALEEQRAAAHRPPGRERAPARPRTAARPPEEEARLSQAERQAAGAGALRRARPAVDPRPGHVRARARTPDGSAT